MKIINPELLASFRQQQVCEVCGQRSRAGRDPHHWFFARGTGEHKRIDHPYNLVAICRVCHGQAHSGQITRQQLLAVVARREGKTEAEIVEELWAIRRAA